MQPQRKTYKIQDYHQSIGLGRGQGRRPNQGRYDKSNVECYNCHEFGHFSWECKNNMEERNNFVESKNEDENGTLLLS